MKSFRLAILFCGLSALALPTFAQHQLAPPKKTEPAPLPAPMQKRRKAALHARLTQSSHDRMAIAIKREP